MARTPEEEREYKAELRELTKSTSELRKQQSELREAMAALKSPLLDKSVSLVQEISLMNEMNKTNRTISDRLKKQKEELSLLEQTRKQNETFLNTQKNLIEEMKYKQSMLAKETDYMQQMGNVGNEYKRLMEEHAGTLDILNDLQKQEEEAQKSYNEAKEKYTDALRETTKTERMLNNTKKASLVPVILKTVDLFRTFNNTIRETQKQFGVAASQAGKIQFGSLVESVQSLGSDVFVTSQEIMNAQSAFQEQFGGIITSDAASALAQEAKQLGITTQQMAAARRVFMTQTMGNLSSANAQQDMFIQEFRDKGLTAKDAMESIINNSELMARNGTRFATSFARAAADAKKIGVDLGKVDQIGDNIIGDFEGFLEKQAELGAMGFGFDSFRLGQVAETGDTGALMEELRSQLAATGKDLTNLRRSEQLALSSAFGIPMAELQRMAGPTAGSGEQTEPIDVTNDWLSKIFNWIEKGAVFASMAASLVTIAGSSVATAFNTGILAGKSALGGIGRGASVIGRGIASVGRGVAAAGSVAAGATAATAATAIGGLAGGMYIGDRINEATGSATLGDFWKYNVRGGANDRREQEAMEARVRELRAQRPVQPGTIERAQRQTQQSQSADIAELSKKLDQVVRAIGSMEVRMDGNKVGQVIVGSEQRVTTSAPFRAART